MPKLKYVGVKKDGETAFFHETGGITWLPGTVKTIADRDLAAKMLRHPDVFALADAEPEADGAPVVGVFGHRPAEIPATAAGQVIEPDAVVTETKTGSIDDAAITLAPGGTVSAEAAPVPTPAPTPAPTQPPAATPKDSAKAKAPAKKAAAKKTGKAK
jgi:hypothetical protein